MRGTFLFLVLWMIEPGTASARSLGDVALEVFNTLTSDGQVVKIQSETETCKVRLAAAGWVKSDCGREAEREQKKSL